MFSKCQALHCGLSRTNPPRTLVRVRPAFRASSQRAMRYPFLFEDLGSCGDGGARERRYNFILVSDLDHTMVQNEDRGHTQLLEFGRHWWGSGLGLRSGLIYATGRSPALYKALWAQAPLLTPQVLICSVGTEILKLSRQPSGPSTPGITNSVDRSCTLAYIPDQAWLRHLTLDGWDRDKVFVIAERFAQLKLQVPSEQRPHKVSFKLQQPGHLQTGELLQQLTEALQAERLGARVIFSGGVDVDVIPQRAGKGKALEFILDQLKGSKESVGAPAEACLPDLGIQVCGDSGNDIDMMEVPGVNVCAVGRDPQLLDYVARRGDTEHVYLANRPCAGGILEAMEHFGTTRATDGHNRDQKVLSTVAHKVQQLGSLLATTVIVPVDAGSDATEDIARIETGMPLSEARNSQTVTISKELLGKDLAPSTPDASLQLHLSGGLQLRQQHEQLRPAFTDLQELSLQPSNGCATVATGEKFTASFQVYALLGDGSRDLASSITCDADLSVTWQGENAHVAVVSVHASTANKFAVP